MACGMGYVPRKAVGGKRRGDALVAVEVSHSPPPLPPDSPNTTGRWYDSLNSPCAPFPPVNTALFEMEEPACPFDKPIDWLRVVSGVEPLGAQNLPWGRRFGLAWRDSVGRAGTPLPAVVVFDARPPGPARSGIRALPSDSGKNQG